MEDALIFWCRPASVCQYCSDPADFECDYPVDAGACDALLCTSHAVKVGRDAHYCMHHLFDLEEALRLKRREPWEQRRLPGL